jgi:hypothetical protein
MQKLSNKFLKKDWTFDFIYLLILITVSIVFLISTYSNKPLFEADDLKLLRTPEKLLMVVIVIPIIEEFSMRGLFVVNNKLNIILWTLCLIAVFFLPLPQPWVLTPVMSGLITLSLLLFSILNLDELSIVLYQTIFLFFYV